MSDAIVSPPIFTSRLVRELKGAPLACIVLLSIVDGPVSNEWICQMSGYTDKPVSSALKMLSSPEYQFVQRYRGGWKLSDWFQLPLESRKISDPTTTALIELNLNNTNAVVASRKNSDSDEDKKFNENLEACKSVGIGEPAASRISQLEHVTPDFILAHARGLDRPRQKIGLAIMRITGNEQPPFDPGSVVEVWEAKKYTSGEFAEYFMDVESEDVEPSHATS